MGKIIAIANQKGGVGKTTAAINLSSYLAKFGRKILLIDLDPQGNLTSGLGIDKAQIEKSSYHAILNHIPVNELIISTPIENLNLIPSNLALSGAEIELVTAENREYKLKDVTSLVSSSYDFIFVDTPPSLGLLTINALTAANAVLIPLQCEYYSLEGVSQLLYTINLVKRNLNQQLEIEGILLNMADFRTKLTEQVIAEAREFFKDKTYKTVIPRSVKLSEAPGFGQPILVYDKHSLGSKRYEELAKEFLERNKYWKAIPVEEPNLMTNDKIQITNEIQNPNVK
jgi:chromosome partitioning protein